MFGGAIAWLLEPVPDFAVALGMAAAWGVAGLAPPSLAFGGFASSAWVIALAALGISSAMAASGLLFRIALMLLRVFPPTHRGQVAALLVGGGVLTPVVPTVFGRVATAAPVARELSQALGYARASRESAAIAFAANKDGAVRASSRLGGVVDRVVGQGQAAAARFIVGPAVSIAAGADEWSVVRDDALGLSPVATGRLAALVARVPTVPAVIFLAVVLALVLGLVSPGVFR